MAFKLYDMEIRRLLILARQVGMEGFENNFSVVHIDEVRQPVQSLPPVRPSREWEEWLNEDQRLGSYQHTESKFWHSLDGGFCKSRPPGAFHHAGYRHTFVFTNPHTALEFKLAYGTPLAKIDSNEI